MNSPRSCSLESRSGVIRGQRSRLAHLVPGGQVGLHAVDDLVQLASLLRPLVLQLAGLADGGPQLVVMEVRELREGGVGDEALAAPPPLDLHRRGQPAGETAFLDRSTRPLVSQDLRERGDELPDGAARRAAIQLRFEDVDARLRHATDVRHLGLDLEALGLPAAQLVERPLRKVSEELRIEHLVDAASVLAHDRNGTSAPVGDLYKRRIRVDRGSGAAALVSRAERRRWRGADQEVFGILGGGTTFAGPCDENDRTNFVRSRAPEEDRCPSTRCPTCPTTTRRSNRTTPPRSSNCTTTSTKQRT